MADTTYGGRAGIRDVTQWLIEHYSDDPDRLNFDPTAEQWEKARQEVANGKRKNNDR